MYLGIRVKYPLFLSDFSESCNFRDRYSKNTQILNLIKIRQVGVELSHGRAGGRKGRQAGSGQVYEGQTQRHDSWQMNNVTHKFLSMYLFLFLTLYMFRAHRAHHQERQTVSIQTLVAVGDRVVCWLGVD
jgi:hypothetical protein